MIQYCILGFPQDSGPITFLGFLLVRAEATNMYVLCTLDKWCRVITWFRVGVLGSDRISQSNFSGGVFERLQNCIFCATVGFLKIVWKYLKCCNFKNISRLPEALKIIWFFGLCKMSSKMAKNMILDLYSPSLALKKYWKQQIEILWWGGDKMWPSYRPLSQPINRWMRNACCLPSTPDRTLHLIWFYEIMKYFPPIRSKQILIKKKTFLSIFV